MKRRVFTILVFLLLGAIVNVAVAWALALSIDAYDLPLDGAWRDIDGVGHVEIARAERSGVLMLQIIVHSSGGPSSDDLDEITKPLSAEDLLGRRRTTTYPPQVDDDYGRESVTADARGWPLLSLWCDHAVAIGGTAFDVRGGLRIHTPAMPPIMTSQNRPFGFDERHSQIVPRILPIRPLCPGFAINTVFYAVILWVLFAAPFALRRRRRMRRGLCRRVRMTCEAPPPMGARRI
jgi:hypothetical protein